MCDEKNSLSNLHRMLQENMNTINMRIKSSDDLRQNAIPKDHNDLLQFHIDLSLISTDKEEKIKKLENVRKDIDHSIELFHKILKLQNHHNQNSLLDAEVVNFVLKHDKSKETKMFENLTQKDLCSIVERLEAAKTRLVDIAQKDGLQLQPYEEAKIDEEEHKNRLKLMKEELVLIEETLEEKTKTVEEFQMIIAEMTQERNYLRSEIERLERVDLGGKKATKKKSLQSQIVVHYDLTNCIEYKTEGLYS